MCQVPWAIWVIPDRLGTSTGVSRCTVVPSPSSPLTLRPQVYTVPLASSAAEDSARLPETTCFTMTCEPFTDGRPSTGPGVARGVVVPSPT
jgi:hypothetical protein